MPPVLANLTRRRFALPGLVVRAATGSSAPLTAIHLAALVLMLWTEADFVSRVAFLLAWGLLNCLFLMVVRRPALAGGLALAVVAVLVLLSRLKRDVLFTTVNFVDVMIIDTDTFSFLFAVFPNLIWFVGLAALLTIPALVFIWWVDPFRVRRRSAALGAALCVTGLVALTHMAPSDPYNEFYGREYVSKFARSGVTAIEEYTARGLFESDARIAERLRPVLGESCAVGRRPPNIIMVFDESSFDFSVAPGVKVPAGYRQHFTSFDGKNRKFVVEGINGPSWFTEYNVLTGLSVKSYGRFADFVTRIAAGRVERGLPHTLRRCGYKTFSLYPFMGAFLSARRFQGSTGIETFLDAKDLGATGLEPDRFYFNAALRLMSEEKREKRDRPLFMLVYTAANHFPWDYRYRPELTPEWRDPGNAPEVDEYLRRQSMSAKDYAAFVARLKREFPEESFLIVRFGDHQPSIATRLIDPTLDEATLTRRITARDPRFLTTYYAIDAINFHPVDLSSAVDTLDGPFLPLVVLEAAGLPLDASFAEQKRIFQRCNGLFYLCNSGAEVRRFNRLLMEAGLIKGL